MRIFTGLTLAICVVAVAYAGMTTQEATERLKSLEEGKISDVQIRGADTPTIKGPLIRVVCHPEHVQGKRLCAFVIEVDEKDADKFDNTEIDSPPPSTTPSGDKISYQL